MNSQDRHEKRYQRRKERRLANKQARADAIGGIKTAMSYYELFKSGKRCCNGVRWKQSVQTFERHLFSKTGVSTRKLKKKKWVPSRYTSFLLKERGKIRPIDAPQIQDRQVHKAYTKNVLLPLYLPSMIWNNGASLQGKGFEFSKNMLKKDLHDYYRKYKLDGNVIMLDFKQFFPSAPHDELYKRHSTLIKNDDLKAIGDSIVASNGKDRGMPLGVEPSQAEMIALPSELDNYIKCQLRMKYAGHYMDDYYILVPPDTNAKEVLSHIVKKAESMGLTISKSKTRIQRISKPFKYCKAKYFISETGKVIVNGNRKGVQAARRKIKSFKSKIDDGTLDYEGLWTSINGILAYFNKYNDHTKVLKLRRLFYAIYGFSPEKIQNFRERRIKITNGIYCP